MKEQLLFRIIVIVFFNALEIIQTISFEKMKPTQAANGFLANFLQLKIPSFLFIFLILCKILLSPHNAFTLGITKNNANCSSLNVCLCGNKFLFYRIFYQVLYHPLMDEKTFYWRNTTQNIIANYWRLCVPRTLTVLSLQNILLQH